MQNRKVYEPRLVYMHSNACAGKWRLCKTPIDYEHGSARFYISSKHAAYEVTNVEEVLKIIPNKSVGTTAETQGQK